MRFCVVAICVVLTSSPLFAQEQKNAEDSPTKIVDAFFHRDDEAKVRARLLKPAVDGAVVEHLKQMRASKQNKVEILFEIQDGKTAVVAIGMRGEEYRDGIDIDPLFLVKTDSWKFIFQEYKDPQYGLSPDVVKQLEKLEKQFDAKSDETYAAISKERSKPIEVTAKSLQGMWHALEKDRIAFLNLDPSGKYVSANISNGKVSNRAEGNWTIEKNVLVLKSDMKQPSSRYVVEKVTVDRLIMIDEADPNKKINREKGAEPLVNLFPNLRVSSTK